VKFGPTISIDNARVPGARATYGLAVPSPLAACAMSVRQRLGRNGPEPKGYKRSFLRQSKKIVRVQSLGHIVLHMRYTLRSVRGNGDTAG